MPFKKQHIYIVSGVALSLAALFVIKLYLDQQRQAVQVEASNRLRKIQASQISVLVAKKDIPKGTEVDADSFETGIIPNQFVQQGAVTSLDRIAGMVTSAPIARGDQITLSKLTYSNRTGGLAESTPPGKRAITISVDNISSLGGMIKASDYVDVIAMIPQTVPIGEGKTATQLAVLPLFQNVLVLAVGQETIASPKTDLRFRKESKQEISPLITLALSPQEASLIAFVQEQGRIRLTLRSPADSKIEPIQPASWDALRQYLYPREQREEAEEKQVEQHPPEDYVEIYRGGTKEKVLVTK